MILNGMDAEAAALEEEDRKELQEHVPVIAPGKNIQSITGSNKIRFQILLKYKTLYVDW